MRRLMQSFIGSICALLSFPIYADVLNIDGIIIDVTLNDADLINPGIVWQSSRYFSDTVTFSSILEKDRVSLILSTSANQGISLPFTSIGSLPIDIGNDLKLTFLGSLSGIWGETELSWSASSYEEAKTERFRTNLFTHAAFDGVTSTDKSANHGTLSYQLWPIIYCDNARGCKVPTGSVNIGNYYLRIYSGIIGFEPSEQIISGGTITFQTGCEFSVSPTVFSNINAQRSIAGTFLWTGKSNVSAFCKGSGSGSNLYLRVTPVDGIWSGDGTNRIGLTSRDGLGLLYKFGSRGVQNLSEALTWNTDQLHSALVNNSAGNREASGSIYWTLYQYSNDLSAGDFTATVNYEFWID